MANPLRKTMVYLGLADEEYDDVLPAAPVAPGEGGSDNELRDLFQDRETRLPANPDRALGLPPAQG